MEPTGGAKQIKLSRRQIKIGLEPELKILACPFAMLGINPIILPPAVMSEGKQFNHLRVSANFPPRSTNHFLEPEANGNFHGCRSNPWELPFG